MVNEEFLGKMKADAMLINTARGNVVNEEALLAKLEACPDFWVGTDVYNGEPTAKACDFQNPKTPKPQNPMVDFFMVLRERNRILKSIETLMSCSSKTCSRLALH